MVVPRNLAAGVQVKWCKVGEGGVPRMTLSLPCLVSSLVHLMSGSVYQPHLPEHKPNPSTMLADFVACWSVQFKAHVHDLQALLLSSDAEESDLFLHLRCAASVICA